MHIYMYDENVGEIEKRIDFFSKNFSKEFNQVRDEVLKNYLKKSASEITVDPLGYKAILQQGIRIPSADNILIENRFDVRR